MEDVTIPGWALVVFGVVLLPWGVWLTLKVLDNEKHLAINSEMDKNITGEFTKIYNLIETQRTENKEMFSKLEGKIESLFGYERKVFIEFLSKLST